MATPLTGWQSMIVCDGTVPNPNNLPKCDFGSLITLVNVLISNLVVLSTLLATMVFIYAGFILLTSGGNPGARDRAKGMLGKVVIGYIVVLSAWIIVYTITSVLLDPAGGYSLLGAPR
jgi:hypothetical protein